MVDTGGQAHSGQAGSHSPECEWHLARHLSLSLFSVEREIEALTEPVTSTTPSTIITS